MRLLLILLALFSSSSPALAASPWAEAERLAGEQKLQAALGETLAVLRQAREMGDEIVATEGLIRATQLELGLHGYETAVRFLRGSPWPKDGAGGLLVRLYYAHALVQYQQAYGWEIASREQAGPQGEGDLRTWTLAQIGREISSAFEGALREGPWLEEAAPAFFRPYLQPNTYPASVRPTLRDAVTYLAVSHFADQRFWSARESHEASRLPVERLASGGIPRNAADAPAAHPLEKAASWLGELARRHDEKGRAEASLEARYQRLEILYGALAEEEDRAAVRAALRSLQKGTRGAGPWWARGQALLAELLRGGDPQRPGRLVEARAEALAGEAAFPGSPGAQLCAAIRFEIERPELQLSLMAGDAPAKRSVLLHYRNLRKVHLRAYPVSFEAELGRSQGGGFFGVDQEGLKRKLGSGAKPEAEWSVDLPETPDFSVHRKFVIPPALKPGFHEIVASIRPDFSEPGNLVSVARMLVGDLVLSTRAAEGKIEVRALSGESGRARQGVSVTLYRFDYRSPPEAVKALDTDASGYAAFEGADGEGGARHSFFLVARQGEELAVARDGLFFGGVSRGSDREIRRAFVYTDRSVYRPGQKILLKVAAFSGRGAEGRYRAARAGETVTVRLLDPGSQEAGSARLVLGPFGTASGELTLPSGRPLGAWRIQAAPYEGFSSVRVEEYKRPTFEALLKEAEGALRLNRKAVLAGEARYYFGLPLTGGKVSWRVTREEVQPWWWECWGWWRPGPARGAETVAAGSSELGSDGGFRIEFLPEADERKAAESGMTYSFRVEAEVTDEGGETRSASRSFRLGFVALEAKLDWEQGFFRVGQGGTARAQLSTLDGKPLRGQGHFRVARLEGGAAVPPAELPRDPSGEPLPLFARAGSFGAGDSSGAFATPDDQVRARWETEFRWEAVTRSWSEAETVAEGAVEHDGNGEGRIPLGPLAKPGAYRLIYRTQDSFGATFEASRDFLVAAEKGGALPLPLLVVPERPSARAGDTARVLVQSGLASQPLAVEVFQGGRRISRAFFRGGESPGYLDVPVTAGRRGGFTVVASGVRDHQILRAEAAVEVPWRDRELKVGLSTFRDKLRPGRKESFRITVRSAAGEALRKGGAEVLAYMYDRSLDLFGPHEYPSVLSLYPSRTGAPHTQFTLGASTTWSLFHGLPEGPQAPYFAPEQLSFHPGYGIGGPGSRGRPYYKGIGGGMAAMEMAADSSVAASKVAAPTAATALAARQAAPAPAPAPSPPSEERSVNVNMRANFSETAFFLPHLVTGADGSASVEFTAPESVTSWRVLAHALTRDLRGGSVSREASTVKELMVRPSVPRFLREGDEAEIRVQVSNSATAKLSGELAFDIEDENGRSALSRFAFAGEARKAFTVPAGASTTLVFPVRAPSRPGSYALRVVARGQGRSDGELRPFPVLPARLRLVQSRFAALHDKDSRVLDFPEMADPARQSEQLVVTVDAQLFTSVLHAMPYILTYPYRCVESVLNRFLATGIVGALYTRFPETARLAEGLVARKTRLERFDEPDPNRAMRLEETPWLEAASGGQAGEGELLSALDPKAVREGREGALAELRKLQLPSGAFPWFPGGPPDEHMTVYVLLGLTRALEFGVEVPKDLVAGGWRFVRGWLDERLDERIKGDHGWEAVTMVSFALSGYPADEWTGGHFDQAYRDKLLGFSFRHWKEHSPLLKGYLALALLRAKRDADARLVWDSVMDSARSDERLGTYWAREDRSWLWYNDEVETHAFALRALDELQPGDKRAQGLVQWLFLNKKLNHWKSTRATGEALYSLARHLDRQGRLGVREEVKVEAAGQSTVLRFEPGKYTGRRNQVVVPGTRLGPAAARVVVSKPTPGMAFASATWHFSTDALPAGEQGDFLHVSRRYFKREYVGGEWRLTPLAEGEQVAVGDQVEVQLSLRAAHEAEYVHLRDPRGAGFEPESLASGYKWDLGLSWYEETRDSGANFFFSRLPVGEYTLRYRLRASMAGTFRAGPATLQSLYAPEFHAYSAGSLLRVGAGK